MSSDKPTVRNLPSAPQRTDPPEDFASKADDFVRELDPFGQDQNELADWMDGRVDDADSAASKAESARDAAKDYRDEVEDSATLARSNANFKGRWSDLSGSASVPSSVYHDDKYWQLLEDVDDVTEHEPGESDVWTEIVLGNPFLRTPTITTPSDGSSEVSTTVELEGTPFSPVYSSVKRDYRQFQVKESSASWDDSSVVDEQVDQDSLGLSLDPNQDYDARIRDVDEEGNETNWSTVISFTTADQEVLSPTLEYPNDDSDSEWEFIYFVGSQFQVRNGKQKHEATKVEVYESGTLVYDEEKTGLFDPNDYSGSDQIGELSSDTTIVSASDNESEAYKLFDKDDTTYWQISSTSGWIQVEPDLSRDPYVTGVDLTIRDTTSAPDQAPKDFRLQGSLDGSDWFDLEEWTDETDWSEGETKSFSVSDVSGTGYPYIRLYVDDNNGDGTLELSEVVFYTHTEQNPLEVFDYPDTDGITDTLTTDTDYSVRIGYRMEGETEFTFSDEIDVTTYSSIEERNDPGYAGAGGFYVSERVDRNGDRYILIVGPAEADSYQQEADEDGVPDEASDGQMNWNKDDTEVISSYAADDEKSDGEYLTSEIMSYISDNNETWTDWPVFNFLRYVRGDTGSIGPVNGYSDWYIPGQVSGSDFDGSGPDSVDSDGNLVPNSNDEGIVDESEMADLFWYLFAGYTSDYGEDTDAADLIDQYRGDIYKFFQERPDDGTEGSEHFDAYYYWSSTESGSGAYRLRFPNGSQSQDFKSTSASCVRCVRRVYL